MPPPLSSVETGPFRASGGAGAGWVARAPTGDIRADAGAERLIHQRAEHLDLARIALRLHDQQRSRAILLGRHQKEAKQAKLEDVQINRKEEKKITQDDRDEELPAESGFVRRAVRVIERNPQQNWRHL